MTKRRLFLLKAAGILSSLLFLPISAIASVWNKMAFESVSIEDAFKGLQVSKNVLSNEIQIIAPEKAENGAVVQVEIRSNLANTQEIAILVEKNPTPLIANFSFANGIDPYVVTRIKMAETSDILALVKADNQYFLARKSVEVLENGCG